MGFEPTQWDPASSMGVWSRAMRDDPALQEMLAHAVDSIPLGRLGLTLDIAEAIGFLASARASYVTGQQLMVDGGQTV